MRRRFTLTTTLYGKRLVTRAELYQLHREISRAASLARQDDPQFVAKQQAGKLAAGSYWRR